VHTCVSRDSACFEGGGRFVEGETNVGEGEEAEKTKRVKEGEEAREEGREREREREVRCGDAHLLLARLIAK